jgi:hypothetical protein
LVIANILLDKAASIMAADQGIGQAHVLDLGVQLAPIVLVILRPKMTVILSGRPMVRLASSRRSPSKCGAAIEDEVVAELDLPEEQPVLAARLPARPRREIARRVEDRFGLSRKARAAA